MDHKTVEDYILSLPNVALDYPFGEGVAVYKVGGPSNISEQAKMFALISEAKDPVNLSLKCDPQLAETLREKYVTVMPGYHLNKKHWNTLILSGELSWDEVRDLVRHSYDLVAPTPLHKIN
jgi:predicted DNA-binding protein (MmcQ/YjbR family)